MLGEGFKDYKKSFIGHDIVAGLVVAALSIPVTMGYAQVAGLPPIYGLFASIIPPLIYAVLTKTKSIVFGMDSATSATIGAAVVSMGITLGSGDAASLIPQLTLVSSLFLILFAISRLGKVMSYVPIPVLNGFITGISVTVIISQIPLILGVDASAGDGIVSEIAAIVSTAPLTNIASLIMGIACIVVLFVCGKLFPKIPISLIVLVAATVLTVVLHLDSAGVAVLGSIPSGLPSLQLPQFDLSSLPTVLLFGFAIAIVSASESLLTVEIFAMQDGQLVNENKELAAFGIANVVSSVFGCAACSASLSRSAAGRSASGHSQLVSVISCVTILITVIFLSPCLYYVPQPVLGAVVIVALVNVIDFGKIGRYAKYMKIELLVFGLTALGVIFLGALPGVIIGVALAFIVFIYRKHDSRHEKLLGVISEVDAKASQQVPEGTLIMKIDGAVTFVNVMHVISDLLEKLQSNPKTVLLDISGVNELDTTATDRIVKIIEALKKRQTKVRIIRSVSATKDHYTRFELEHLLKQAKIYPSVEAALEKIPQEETAVIECKDQCVKIDD